MESEALHARTLQLTVVLDALRSRDRAYAEQMEWDFATQLQMEGLPQDFPAFPDHPEFDVRAGMVTAQEVGGDLYDFFLLGPDRLGFVVADASGKGLPAAIFITLTRTLLRAAARRERDPGACLTLLNGLLAFDNPEVMFVTGFYGILDLTSGEVAYANAGHPSPLVLQPDGTLFPLPSRRRPVMGVQETFSYATERRLMQPGETLICFTDGVTEAHNPAQELFGDDRLQRNLAPAARSGLEAILAGIIGDVDHFMGVAPVADDVTLLLLRWNG